MAAIQDLVQAVLNPSPLGLVLAVLFALLIPLFLHRFIFQSSGLTTLPSILLIGPSGSGKTALLTLVNALPRLACQLC
jgi:signal recognition particle receptor subunit beta